MTSGVAFPASLEIQVRHEQSNIESDIPKRYRFLAAAIVLTPQ
ncbi:hypothetical protein QOZ95_001388 [Paenibacillus brasilensis]|uniref:Uncharacterized protein n=1 Tax=Paenibacillus brasilensis TaxID=128574 RepID=A0ABU0KV14_9BACL|nr:hypothetical protein [Paenibacillus brasilensis]